MLITAASLLSGMRCTPVLFLAAGLLLSTASMALDCGQNPTHLTHFEHTAWTLADGAPPDVWALAQSPDGYLWLGTGAGLYRFDGVRFEPIHPSSGDSFPSVDITALLALASGDIWIGYQSGGVSVLHDGKLTNFTDGVAKGPVHRLVEDKDHTIWVAADHGLARFVGGRWRETGADWAFPPGGANDLFVARDGTLWVTISAGKSAHQDRSVLAFLRRGSRHFEMSDESISIAAALAQGPDGRLWVSDHELGARALPESLTGISSKQRNDDYRPVWSLRPLKLIFDNYGGLWGLHESGGVFHLSSPILCARRISSQSATDLEHITLENGLTSDIAASLITDSEGNIFVGTNLGLDRFRAANVVTETGVPVTSSEGYRVTQGSAGALYVSANRTLYRVDPSGASKVIYRSSGPTVFLHTTRNGELWLGTESGLWRLTASGWTRVQLPQSSRSAAIWKFEEDPRGVLWIALWEEGIFYLDNHKWKKFEPRADLANRAPNLMATDADGRKWLYYFGGLLVLVDGTKVRTFSAEEGPAVGDIQVIVASPHGVLLAGEFGIAQYDGKNFRTLRSSQFPLLSRITGIVQTAAGETWINGIMGIVRVSTSELQLALANPSHGLRYDLFNFRDGLPGLAQQDSFEPTALEGSDGRLWFITSHGIAWVDPAHLIRNHFRPPVAIRGVTVNGRQFVYSADLKLPPSVANLQIDYTAPSLTAPDRVRFRYELEGVDKSWVEAGARRQAFYTNLAPGSYRFQVIAANEDGVWNRDGMSLRLEIAPTFFQSLPFKVIRLLAALGLLWLIYSLRLRSVAAHIRLTANARLNERERIARALHDTLLQGFQGLMLRLQAVADRVKSEPEQAHRLIEQALERADAVLQEGRDCVQDLRTSYALSGDLSEIFIRMAEDARPQPAKVRVTVEGEVRELQPLVSEEVARIGGEAITNAARHAKAATIDVEIRFERRQLVLRVSDDGIGMDAAIAHVGRRGHFGLRGMHERSRQIGGSISIASRPGVGTEIELIVPGGVAYVTRQSGAVKLWRRRVVTGAS